MKIARNFKQMGTHIPLLIRSVQATRGDVCELGAGFASTGLLHWLSLGRKLVTYETDPDYFKYAKSFQTNTHKVRLIKDFSEVDFDRAWSVVLIDHSCQKPHTRGDDAVRFKNADLLILHDTEPESRENYGYDKIFSQFKYRLDWTLCKPHASIVSNKIDVTKWNFQS